MQKLSVMHNGLLNFQSGQAIHYEFESSYGHLFFQRSKSGLVENQTNCTGVVVLPASQTLGNKGSCQLTIVDGESPTVQL